MDAMEPQPQTNEKAKIIGKVDASDARFAIHIAYPFFRKISLISLIAGISLYLAGFFISLWLFIPATPLLILALITRPSNSHDISVRDEPANLTYETDSKAFAWKNRSATCRQIDAENRLRSLLLAEDTQLSDAVCEWVCVRHDPEACEFRITTNDPSTDISTFEKIAGESAKCFGDYSYGSLILVGDLCWSLCFSRNETERAVGTKGTWEDIYLYDTEDLPLETVCDSIDYVADEGLVEMLLVGSGAQENPDVIGIVMDKHDGDGTDADSLVSSLDGEGIEAFAAPLANYGGTEGIDASNLRYAVLTRAPLTTGWLVHAAVVDEGHAERIKQMREDAGLEARVVEIIEDGTEEYAEE